MLSGCALVALVGCSSDDDPASSSSRPSTTVTDATSTVPVTRVSLNTAVATSTTDPPRDLVADCVEWIPIGAFAASEPAASLWNLIAQDGTQLVTLCNQLAENEPEMIEQLSTQLVDYSAAVDTTQPSDESAPSNADPVDSTETVPMPELVCVGLEEAQDIVEDLTGARARVFDASGEGRPQEDDDDWMVVSQSPGAGTQIGVGDALLGVMMIGERSQC